MNALNTLRRLLGGGSARQKDAGDEARLAALETHVKALYDHAHQSARELQQLRQDEARRAAEHAAMVDQLNRLYRRMSARIAREAEHPITHPSDNGESVAALRRRLGR